ncbi:uncharacterized protein BDR25DRAFT_339687 [Lindgomyces ingoldianus]|uniref:Uncharacterized protein n=1 Tax=Lindgomyces ingoldianus TaxID=673940 RepID=A0ACB6RA73_9PLEO|nr:uncharacterized protein BDR25DRAFT_339687 [Lindgomyces ingoldianus]KAF2475630.1 hypothetical protein BDR25DRAFT_339687 [Lindgomyces ingoldianus]
MLFYVIWFVLNSASANANVLPSLSPSISDPTITPAPQLPPLELLRKQNDNRFLGWVSYKGAWTSEQCDLGGTYYQSGSFARCCATSVASCNVVIGCVDGSLIYGYSTGTVSRRTYACTDVFTDLTDRSFTICNTGFIFENTKDSSPHSNIFCGVSSLNWSYYRVKPEETSSTPTPTPSSTPQSITATPTSTPTSSSTAAPIESPTSKKSSSKAWIAGVVVGPIAAIAIGALVVWIILLKRKHKKEDGNPPASIPQTPHPPYSPGGPNGQPPRESYIPYNPQMQQGQGHPPGMLPYPMDAQRTSYMSNGHSPTSPTTASNSPMPQASPYGPLSHSPQPGQQGYQQQQQQWQPIQQPTSPQMMSPQYTPQQPILVDAGGLHKTPSPQPLNGNNGMYSTQPELVPPPQQIVR